MSKLVTAMKLFNKSKSEFMSQVIQNLNFLFPDKIYLSLLFRYRMGYWMDWNFPKTFSEKLQWLKLYDRNPLYTQLVDKYEVKAYVEKKIGREHIAKTYGVWSNPDMIDFDSLPSRFVLKTTHGGGNTGVLIVKDKTIVNVNTLKSKLYSSLKQDLYRDSREWPYKHVKRRIIAEEFLEDQETGELRDYKFFCFGGKVKALFVATERQTRDEPFFNFFDADYNPLNIRQGHPVAVVPPAKPALFAQMKNLAEVLSKGLPCVRVDLYQANGQIYFGEYTFYHFGGTVPFEPSIWDGIFGSWIDLATIKHQI